MVQKASPPAFNKCRFSLGLAPVVALRPQVAAHCLLKLIGLKPARRDFGLKGSTAVLQAAVRRVRQGTLWGRSVSGQREEGLAGLLRVAFGNPVHRHRPCDRRTQLQRSGIRHK